MERVEERVNSKPEIDSAEPFDVLKALSLSKGSPRAETNSNDQNSNQQNLTPSPDPVIERDRFRSLGTCLKNDQCGTFF
jgi:hypothetical protein